MVNIIENIIKLKLVSKIFFYQIFFLIAHKLLSFSWLIKALKFFKIKKKNNNIQPNKVIEYHSKMASSFKITNCLVLSLSLYTSLLYIGHKSSIKIGIQKSFNSDFKSHSWIESDLISNPDSKKYTLIKILP